MTRDGDHPLTGSCRLRPAPGSGGTWYLKVLGDPAWHLFLGLAGEGREHAEIRRGVHILGSTKNARDPVVVEIRLDGTGQLVPIDSPDLHHSFRPRIPGTCTIEGRRLLVTGAAAGAIAALAGGTEPVLWTIADLRRGELTAPASG